MKPCKMLIAVGLLFLCACSTPTPSPTQNTLQTASPEPPTASVEARAPKEADMQDLTYRLDLEPSEIISEWTGYLTDYFENNPAPTIQVKSYNYSPYGLVVVTAENLGELEAYTTDNGTSGMPEFLVTQDTANRSFLFSIGAYGFELPSDPTSASLIIGDREITFSNAMISSTYSAGPNGADGKYVCIQLTDAHGELAKDKGDQIKEAFAESDSCKIVYHGSSGEDYTVSLSGLHTENLHHVVNAFSELLTYYYQ